MDGILKKCLLRTMMESLSFLIKKESLSSSVFSALNQGEAAACAKHCDTKTSVFPQFYPSSDTSSPACLLSVNDDDDDDDEYIIEKNDDENVCLLDDDVGGFNAFNNNTNERTTERRRKTNDD